MKKMTKIISLIIVCLIVVLMPQNNYAIANAEESISVNENLEKTKTDATSSALLMAKHVNSKEMSAEERTLRETVVGYMYSMGTILWTTPVTINTRCVSTCEDANCNRVLTQGQMYRGLPYKHSSSTLDRMQYCLDGSNSLKTWVVNLGNFGGFQTYFGSACYSSIQLAWARVSNTVNATCAMEALLFCDQVGTIPVGGWYDAWENKLTDQNTQDCIDLLGRDAIYEDYALAKQGDAFIKLGAEGAHAVMAATDPVIVRYTSGKINPSKSYFYTHEQGGPNNAPTGVISSWSISRKRTFASLLDDAFLPVTIKELAEGHSDTVTVSIEDDCDDVYGITTGVIKSNFYIDAVTVDIKENGQSFFNKKVYCRIDNIKDYDGTIAFFDRNFVKEYDLALLSRSVQDLTFNSNKTYHVKFTVLLMTGEEYVVKEFDF